MLGLLGVRCSWLREEPLLPPFDPGDEPQGTKLYACLFLSLSLSLSWFWISVLGGPWSVCTGVEPGPGMCQGKF